MPRDALAGRSSYRTRKKKSRKEVTKGELAAFVVGLVTPLFAFPFEGRFPLRKLVEAVVFACLAAISIEGASRRRRAPPGWRLRYHLRKLDVEAVERKANLVLKKVASALLEAKGRYALAVDLVFVPYHGRPQAEEDEVRRSVAKAGTTHFHAYATLYAVVRGKRLTVAVTYVRAGVRMADVVERLYGAVRALGIRPDRWYLDKAFCSVAVIRYLRSRGQRAVIACPSRRGRMRALMKGRKSKVVRYAIRSATEGEEVVRLAVVTRYTKGKYGRRGAVTFAYVLLGLRVSPRWAYELYRRRFGIESSYKLMHRSRARTSSRSPALRLLYASVSLILQDAWVYLNCGYVRERERGRREPSEPLRYPDFLDLVAEGLRDLLGRLVRLKVRNRPRVDLLDKRTFKRWMAG